MDGVALLHRAWDAGLRVEAAGEMLKITGPKRAEPVVRLLAKHKAEILAALAPNKNEPSYWRERFTARTFEWLNGNRNWDTARRIAWGDLENEWHSIHGRRWPAWQCAGCGEPISALDRITRRQHCPLRANRLHHRVRSTLAGRCAKGFNCAGGGTARF
jgi:hypothetical protein